MINLLVFTFLNLNRYIVVIISCNYIQIKSYIMTSNSEAPGQVQKAQYRTMFGAQILWPIDCSDDIIEAVIKQVKNQQTQHKLALDKHGLQIAQNLKNFLDKKFEPFWHVFLGNNFGAYSVHEKNRFMYFYYKKIAFLIYKAQ